MFWFKTKKVVVDCFTDDSGVYNFHPITKGTSAYPTWWKNIPLTVKEQRGAIEQDRYTIKGCDGFIALFKNSWMLSSWTDFQIKTDDVNYGVVFAKNHVNKNMPMTQSHHSAQVGPTFDDKIHLKLISPWLLKQNRDCEFALLPAVWHSPGHWQNYTVLPGVLDFKYQYSTNINLFLEKNKDTFIPAGTPFYHIVPLTEHAVEFKSHLVSTDEFNKLYNFRYGTFNGNYKNQKKVMQEKKTCPFH